MKVAAKLISVVTQIDWVGGQSIWVATEIDCPPTEID
jgi:hypothetical protein